MGDTDLTIKFKVQDDGSVQLDKFSGKLAEIPKHTSNIQSSLSLIKWDSIVNLGQKAFEAAEKMYNLAKSTASALNDIERSAKVANMTTNEYQKMAYAAKMSDVSIEELSTGMKILSRNMDEAEKGAITAVEQFERIGISVRDSSGKMKGLNEIMLAIADKFSTWEDGPRKIAIAIDLFGRSGERLIPYLNQGAAGIKGFYEEAERLGIVLDEKMIKAGSEMEDKFKRVEAWWDSLKKKVVMSVAEMIGNIGEFEKTQESVFDKYVRMIEEGTTPAEEKQNQFITTLEEEEARLGKLMAERAKTEAQAAKAQAPAGRDLAKAAADEKIFREVNSQLLKDQEATLRRIVELQTQLNKSGDEAIAIMDRLGIGTKASLTQWVEKDIVGEYEKLLGSGLFSKEEMVLAQEEYIGALKRAMTPEGGGWGSEFRQIEEAIKRIQTMKIEDTAIEKTRNEFDQLKKTAAYLENFTGKISLDDNDVVRARDQISELRTELSRLVSQDWNIRISMTGYGSSELPIMEKIAQVSGAFRDFGSEVGNMILKVNMGELNSVIAQEKQRIIQSQAPMYGLSYSYTKGYYSAKRSETKAIAEEHIANLEMYKQMLTSAAAYAGGQTTPADSSYGESAMGGGGSGNISVNIGTINVNGENAAEIAENLDAQLADLYLRDRSKLKNAIQGSA